MKLIDELKIIDDSLRFKYYETKKEGLLINIGFTIAEYFKFNQPTKDTENHIFCRIFLGNIIDEDGDKISHYVLLRQNEETHFLTKTDEFDNLFKKIK